jgi:hypothetical protein
LPKVLFILALITVAFLPARAETPAPAPTLRVTAADPGGIARLGLGDALYLRVSYKSAVPLRLQAEGFFDGKARTKGESYNPAPVSAAGTRESLVWVAYRGTAQIDTVRITAYGANWKPIATLSYPVTAEWRDGLTSGKRAAWVSMMKAEQQAMVASALTPDRDNTDDSGAGFLISLALFSIPAYIALQIVLLIRYSGRWRIAAALPLIGMVPLLLYTVLALIMGSNLWPLMAIFLTPFALLYLVAVLGLRRFASGAAFS